MQVQVVSRLVAVDVLLVFVPILIEKVVGTVIKMLTSKMGILLRARNELMTYNLEIPRLHGA